MFQLPARFWAVEAVLLAACTVGVACSGSSHDPGIPGTIEISSVTAGQFVDGDGYVVVIDGQTEVALPATGSTSVPDMAAGTHTVKLTAVSANCFLGGPGSQTVWVPSGGTGTITFSASCRGPLSSRIVFSGAFGEPWEIYVMDADGSNLAQLTHDPTEALYPAVSPDGTRIAFATRRDGGQNQIYLMNADGSNQVRLTHDSGDDIRPAWSPDGGRVLFEDWGTLFMIDADGSGRITLTEGFDAAWSPDGTRIAFTSIRSGFAGLYTIAPDRSQLVQLTDDPTGAGDYAPDWSPNGLEIVFARGISGFGGHLFVMDADGSRVRQITSDPLRADNIPVWSPDGFRIAFASSGNGTTQIGTIGPDGSGYSAVTQDNTAAHEGPSWLK